MIAFLKGIFRHLYGDGENDDSLLAKVEKDRRQAANRAEFNVRVRSALRQLEQWAESHGNYRFEAVTAEDLERHFGGVAAWPGPMCYQGHHAPSGWVPDARVIAMIESITGTLNRTLRQRLGTDAPEVFIYEVWVGIRHGYKGHTS